MKAIESLSIPFISKNNFFIDGNCDRSEKMYKLFFLLFCDELIDLKSCGTSSFSQLKMHFYDWEKVVIDLKLKSFNRTTLWYNFSINFSPFLELTLLFEIVNNKTNLIALIYDYLNRRLQDSANKNWWLLHNF